MFPHFCFAVLFMWSSSASGTQSPPALADAIIVLAGSYQERVPAAATLFHDGHAVVIILANDGVHGGWSQKYQRNLYQIERAEELLIESGVPRKQIVLLPFYGSGTVYDALAVGRYAKAHDFGRLLLVTSDYHVRRTLWTFRHVMGDWPLTISVCAVSSVESGAMKTVQEYVKLLYYKIRFGVLGLVPEIREL